jgi:hypothetical protein
MATYTYETGAEPTIRLYACNDNISILGVDSTTIELSTSADDDLDELVTQSDAELRIERIEERLTLRVPRGAQIDIEQQNGDINIQDVAAVRLIDVSGDVKLRSISGAVEIDAIEGDLTIDRAGAITGRYLGGDIRCSGAASLLLNETEGDARVLDTAAVQIERISGDAHIVGAHERCRVGVVDGGLRVRGARDVDVRVVAGDGVFEQIAALEVQTIAGDCTITSESGSVTLTSIDGDLNARIQQGPLSVISIAGDARIEGVSAGLQLGSVAGDLDLRLEPIDGATYEAHAAGDALVGLPASCNLTIEAQVEGSISGMNGQRGRRHNSTLNAVLGSGAAQLTLSVDGDLNLRGAGVRSQMRVLQPARTVEIPAPRVYSAATGATVRLQSEPQRRARQAGSSDEERLALLRMLAEGRLSIEEADQLLTAVDQRGAVEPRSAAAAPAADPFSGFTPRQRQQLNDHGVDAAYIAELQRLGLTDLPPDELVALCDHDIKPEFIQALHAYGLIDLSPRQLIRLNDHGVDRKLLQALLDVGCTDASPEQLVIMVDLGIDHDVTRELPRSEGDALSAAQIIELYQQQG